MDEAKRIQNLHQKYLKKVENKNKIKAEIEKQRRRRMTSNFNELKEFFLDNSSEENSNLIVEYCKVQLLEHTIDYMKKLLIEEQKNPVVEFDKSKNPYEAGFRYAVSETAIALGSEPEVGIEEGEDVMVFLARKLKDNLEVVENEK